MQDFALYEIINAIDLFSRLETMAKMRSLTIYVVENHEDIRTYLTRYLEQLGHTVNSGSDMQTALADLANNPPDVLISDIGLPDGDGWELLRSLKNKPFAIAMSGFGENGDHIRSLSVGYKHHLTKPFLPEELDVLLAEAAGNPGD